MVLLYSLIFFFQFFHALLIIRLTAAYPGLRIENTYKVTVKWTAIISHIIKYFDALSSYYDRKVEIPDTREPGVIHHARLVSMESNVFTLIGSRMKGGRACWNVEGGNNLSALLCIYHTSKPHSKRLILTLVNLPSQSYRLQRFQPQPERDMKGLIIARFHPHCSEWRG